MLLRWQRGELVGYVEGRCGSVNKCDYCAIQTAHENARMLGLDCLDDTRPQLLAILGTGLPTLDSAPFYGGRREVMRALRDRFGRQVQYCALQEFTTGKGLRSGGLRRPHWNLFIKGIDAGDVDEARAIVRARWCANVPDADPEAQYVELVRNVGAAAKYVAMHFHKRDQAPPEGWRGQRFNASRGYFGELTRAQARARARESLQRDREYFKVQRDAQAQDLDLCPGQVDEIVDEVLRRNAERVWTRRTVNPIAAEKILRACSGSVQPAQDAGKHVQPASGAL